MPDEVTRDANAVAWYVVEAAVEPDELDVVSGALWAGGVLGIEERPRPDGTVVLLATVHGDRLEATRTALGDRPHGVRGVPPSAPPEPVVRAVAVGRGATVQIASGAAFGWGGHVTTRLAIGLLAAAVEAGATVLDVGTGSGVLAVAAARLGAARVTAVDIDPVAVGISRGNVVRNDLADVVEVVEGSTDAVHGRYGVVVANLDHPTLLTVAQDLLAAVDDGGQLIVSGFLTERAESVQAALADFVVRDRLVDGEWTALAGMRADELS